MTEFDFVLPGITYFFLYHYIGLIEDSSFETCGRAYFTYATWKNDIDM